MGIEYHLVSDSARVGYELGKGAWCDDGFKEALRSDDPIAAMTAFVSGEVHCSLMYAIRVAVDVVSFVEAHPDWRTVNDCSDDYDVVDDDAWASLIKQGLDPGDKFWRIYRQVGTRYKGGPAATGLESESVALATGLAPADRDPPALVVRPPSIKPTEVYIEKAAEIVDEFGRRLRKRTIAACGCWSGEVFRGSGGVNLGGFVGAPTAATWIQQTENCEVHGIQMAMAMMSLAPMSENTKAVYGRLEKRLKEIGAGAPVPSRMLPAGLVAHAAVTERPVIATPNGVLQLEEHQGDDE